MLKVLQHPSRLLKTSIATSREVLGLRLEDGPDHTLYLSESHYLLNSSFAELREIAVTEGEISSPCTVFSHHQSLYLSAKFCQLTAAFSYKKDSGTSILQHEDLYRPLHPHHRSDIRRSPLHFASAF